MEDFTPLTVLLIGAAWIVLHWILRDDPMNIVIQPGDKETPDGP